MEGARVQQLDREHRPVRTGMAYVFFPVGFWTELADSDGLIVCVEEREDFIDGAILRYFCFWILWLRPWLLRTVDTGQKCLEFFFLKKKKKSRHWFSYVDSPACRCRGKGETLDRDRIVKVRRPSRVKNESPHGYWWNGTDHVG